MMRSAEEWSAHPQARALAALPLFTIERIGDAPAASARARGATALRRARARPDPDRRRARVRAHARRARRRRAADRLADAPVPGVARDRHRARQALRARRPRDRRRPRRPRASARGRRRVRAGLSTRAGSRRAASGPLDAARLRPGIVYVSLCAYSHVGPWSGRRGFDSLVQTATGFNHAEGVAAGVDGPKELPAQALDHGSGQLMAAAAMLARARQAREGGSWHVRVSLAQTGRWLFGLGRVPNGLAAPDPSLDDVAGPARGQRLRVRPVARGAPRRRALGDAQRTSRGPLPQPARLRLRRLGPPEPGVQALDARAASRRRA